MQLSAEVRWFARGELPAALRQWFRDPAHPAGGGDLRADVYVRQPGQTELGIKRRGSKPGLEVKGLIGTGKSPLASPPFEGPVQLWCKWTAEDLELADAPGVRVEKRRWLRKFSLDRSDVREVRLDPREQPVGGASLPDEGCNLELTEITVGTATWWSLGFESFGKLTAIERNLVLAVEAVAAESPPSLAHVMRLSYPEWLEEQRF